MSTPLRRAAILLPVGLCLTALPVAAATGATKAATPKKSAKVTLKDIAFKRARVVIAKGGTVTWTWRDPQVPHNVTSIGAKHFKSSTTKQHGTYKVRFTSTGTYRYHCTIHPGMDGTVVVR